MSPIYLPMHTFWPSKLILGPNSLWTCRTISFGLTFCPREVNLDLNNSLMSKILSCWSSRFKRSKIASMHRERYSDHPNVCLGPFLCRKFPRAIIVYTANIKSTFVWFFYFISKFDYHNPFKYLVDLGLVRQILIL